MAELVAKPEVASDLCRCRYAHIRKRLNCFLLIDNHRYIGTNCAVAWVRVR